MRTLALVLVAGSLGSLGGCASCGEIGAGPDAGPSGAVITLEKLGDGTGTVRSLPLGLDCGVTCDGAEATFADGTPATLDENGAVASVGEGPAEVVTIRAEAARDATLDGLSCQRGTEELLESSDGVLQLITVLPENPVVIQDWQCTARFTQVFTLQVILRGEGSVRGTQSADAVLDEPKRVDCPERCVGAYFRGESDTLTATAEAGHVFAGWGVDCSGAGDSTTVVMDEDKNCEAVFEPETP
jgi:hypothetical protein